MWERGRAEGRGMGDGQTSETFQVPTDCFLFQSSGQKNAPIRFSIEGFGQLSLNVYANMLLHFQLQGRLWEWKAFLAIAQGRENELVARVRL